MERTFVPVEQRGGGEAQDDSDVPHHLRNPFPHSEHAAEAGANGTLLVLTWRAYTMCCILCLNSFLLCDKLQLQQLCQLLLLTVGATSSRSMEATLKRVLAKVGANR